MKMDAKADAPMSRAMRRAMPKAEKIAKQPVRRVDRNGALSLIAKRQADKMPLTEERQKNVVIAYHNAINAMTNGYADKVHFDTLAYALNIGGVLAANGIGEEYAELIPPAKAALNRCRDRWEKTGKFGLDGEGLQAIKDVADLHRAQMEVTTLAELEAAVDAMHKELGISLKVVA